MITIYGAEWCMFCKKAKNLLEDYQLDFEWKDVDTPEVYDELKGKLPQIKQIPQIYWGERHVGGFNELNAEIETHNIGNYGQGVF